jgi:hypothetical protein
MMCASSFIETRVNLGIDSWKELTMDREDGNTIPKEMALQICGEIRERYRGKWYTLAGVQCWFCTVFSKGDPAKMCIGNRPDNRGCNLVNARYDRMLSTR